MDRLEPSDPQGLLALDEVVSFVAEELVLAVETAAKADELALAADDAVAGNDDGNGVAVVGKADRSGSSRIADLGGEFPIGKAGPAWETTTTSFIQTLALNTPQTRVLGKSYQNVWQLDLTEDADQLNFITEAQHAFFVLPIQPGQFIFPAFSTLQNGKHTVSANPNQPFVSTLESLSEVGAGTYYAYSD